MVFLSISQVVYQLHTLCTGTWLDGKQKSKNAVVLIKQWMTKNFLCLNEEYYLPKLSIPSVAIRNEQIVPPKNARNIGFYFDSTMNLKKNSL